jgi:hypothetical protein
MSLTLRLRAIDDEGAAVAGATVRRGGEALAITDTEGVAVVDGVRTGFDAMVVSHPMPAQANIVLSFGEGSSGVVERTLTLHRGAPVRGVVAATDGTPVPGALVAVWTSDEETEYVESDEHGQWMVPAMRAGTFELRARAEGYAPGPAISGTHDGRTEQRDIVVRVATGARLVGRVHDGGVPVVGARVYADTMPHDAHETETDAEGRFELAGLVAEPHQICIEDIWQAIVVMGGDGDEHVIDVELSSSRPAPDEAACAHASDADTEEERTSTLIGRVVRDGAPVSRFAVVRRGRAPYHWSTEPAIIADPDGRFALTGLRADVCTVHVLAEGTAWTSTETITLPPDATYDLGELELHRGLRVTGVVCDATGAPIADARVTIEGSGRTGDTLRDAVDGTFATVSGPDGSFVLDGVPLTQRGVRIGAWHPGHGASARHPVVGHDDALRLVLAPTGAIDGIVEPAPVMGGVIVRGVTDEAGSRVARVRPSGRFVVERLVPGEYTVELVQRSHSPCRIARVTVVAGQRASVRIPPP